MLFNNILYKNTIAGVIPKEKILKNLTLDDVKWYYNNYYSPSVAKIVIVGDIAEDEIISKLDFLKKWEAKPVKIPEIKDYPEIENTQIYLLHKLRSPSSVIIMGHHALTYDVTGEYYKTAIMNYPLGGAFNSRINLNLREDKGYTYGISARFSATKYLGTYFVQTNVKRAATDSAIVEIMKEFKNYAANGITDEELTFTKNSMLNSESLRYETPYQKASFLSKIIEYDLSKDFTQQRAEILKSITKEDINALFKKYIHTDKMVIVVVGNKFAIKKPLETIGYKVKEISLD